MLTGSKFKRKNKKCCDAWKQKVEMWRTLCTFKVKSLLILALIFTLLVAAFIPDSSLMAESNGVHTLCMYFL